MFTFRVKGDHLILGIRGVASNLPKCQSFSWDFTWNLSKKHLGNIENPPGAKGLNMTPWWLRDVCFVYPVYLGLGL